MYNFFVVSYIFKGIFIFQTKYLAHVFVFLNTVKTFFMYSLILGKERKKKLKIYLRFFQLLNFQVYYNWLGYWIQCTRKYQYKSKFTFFKRNFLWLKNVYHPIYLRCAWHHNAWTNEKRAFLYFSSIDLANHSKSPCVCYMQYIFLQVQVRTAKL